MDIEILTKRFCDYSRYILNFSPATIARYRQLIGYYYRYSKITEIEQVNEENIRALLFHGSIERKWKPNTILNYHKTLNVFFKWCIEEKVLTVNPIEKIKPPKLGKHVPKALTKQAAEKILDTVANFPYPDKFLRDRNYAIFATFLFAGLRKNELLTLKFSDVDLENLTLFVRGKGDKDRFIPISYPLAEALKKYLVQRNRMCKTCPEFFTSYFKDKPFTYTGLKRIVNHISKITEIKFTCHSLRHTFASLMLMGGTDIFNVSKLLGHSSIKTTVIYLMLNIEYLHDEMLRHPLNNSYAGRYSNPNWKEHVQPHRENIPDYVISYPQRTN